MDLKLQKDRLWIVLTQNTGQGEMLEERLGGMIHVHVGVERNLKNVMEW